MRRKIDAMRRVAAVAAMFALLAMPVLAQHVSAHGGLGGHVASGGFGGHVGAFGGHSFGVGFASRPGAFAPRVGSFAPHDGGFAPRGGYYSPRDFAPRGFMGPSRERYPTRFGESMNRPPYRGNWGERGNNGWRGEGGDHDRDHHHRRPYYNGFNGYAYPYSYGVYLAYPYDLDPWLDSNWDDSSDNSDNSAQAENGGFAPAPYPDYAEPAPPSGEPAPDGYAVPYPDQNPEQYQPHAAPARAPRQPYAGGSEASRPRQTITVIFKDGRPPEKIQNYMLTSSTLTVLDAQYQQIPVNQIDVAATAAANRSEGINFQVPGSAN